MCWSHLLAVNPIRSISRPASATFSQPCKDTRSAHRQILSLSQIYILAAGRSAPWHDAQLQPRRTIAVDDLGLGVFNGVSIEHQRARDGDVAAAAHADEAVLLGDPLDVRQSEVEVADALSRTCTLLPIYAVASIKRRKVEQPWLHQLL